jgi:hypothetical protein
MLSAWAFFKIRMSIVRMCVSLSAANFLMVSAVIDAKLGDRSRTP